MPNNEKIKNIICKESVKEIINKYILKIYESSEYCTEAYKIKDKLGKLSNRLESSQWINQTYNNMRKKELVDSNFKTGSPKLDNTEKLLKYLSDISEDITEIFKLLRICREVKSSPKIIAWMKHNKLICESAGMLYKKNFVQLKALNDVEINKDTILKYITTLFKDKVLSENYFDEENYKGENEVNNEKSNEENLNGPAKEIKKEIKNEIKTAVLKEKVKSLEGQLEEISNEDVRSYLNANWQGDCKYSNEGAFWPTVQSITKEENKEDIDMGGLYRSTDVEEIKSKTDANSKFDFLEGPEGEPIGATGIWHRKFPEKGGKEGWQIDISPVPPVCAYVLGIVDSVIKKGSFKCEFKWQGDLRIYRGNAKITNKVPKQYRFIVIYPENDTQSRNIAKALHDAFRKANLTKKDFLRFRDAFEIYPGVCTTFRKFTGESSNTSVCIPIDKTVLKEHIEKEGKSEMTYEHPFPSLIWRGKPLPKNVNELSKIVELRLKNKDKNDEKREEKEKLKLKKDDLKRKIIDTQKLKDVFVNNGDLTPYFDYNPDFVEAYYANGSYPNYKIDKGELYHQFKSDPEKAFNKVQADLKSSFSSFIGTCLSLGMESQSLSDFFSKNHILHLDNFQDKKMI